MDPTGCPLLLQILNLLLMRLVRYPDWDLVDFINERMDKSCPLEADRPDLLRRYHSLGHFAAEKLFNAVWRGGHYWPHLRRQCVSLVAACPDCRRWNISKRGFNPITTMVAEGPFDHIALDLAGPYKTSPRGIRTSSSTFLPWLLDLLFFGPSLTSLQLP